MAGDARPSESLVANWLQLPHGQWGGLTPSSGWLSYRHEQPGGKAQISKTLNQALEQTARHVRIFLASQLTGASPLLSYVVRLDQAGRGPAAAQGLRTLKGWSGVPAACGDLQCPTTIWLRACQPD